MCPNNHMLYTKDNTTKDMCNKCGSFRWKNIDNKSSKKNENNIHNTLFSPGAKIEKIFDNVHVAKILTWHHNQWINDGVIRHPTYGVVWKNFDTLHPSLHTP